MGGGGGDGDGDSNKDCGSGRRRKIVKMAAGELFDINAPQINYVRGT